MNHDIAACFFKFTSCLLIIMACFDQQCSVLNEKLESLIKTLKEESNGTTVSPPAGNNNTQSVEKKKFKVNIL